MRYKEFLIEKDLTLRSANGPSSTILSNAGAGSTIIIRPESYNPHIPEVTIDGFTIRDGSGTMMDVYTTGQGLDGWFEMKLGGGILVYNTSPTITNCTFTANGLGNRAGVRRGGGMFASGDSEDIDFPTRDYVCVAPPVSTPMDISSNAFFINLADEGASVYIQNFDDLNKIEQFPSKNYLSPFLDNFNTDILKVSIVYGYGLWFS